MNDSIVDEVRRVRDAYAARFNYDLDAMYRDIKEQEQKSGLEFVDGIARQPVPQAKLPSSSSAARSTAMASDPVVSSGHGLGHTAAG